jgi:hypothetical protein
VRFAIAADAWGPTGAGMSARWPAPIRELPRGDLRGRFWIMDSALEAAARSLPTFRGPDGDHEGIAFFAGFEFSLTTFFASRHRATG